MIPILHTARLIIRPFTMDDIEPSFRMNLDAEVSKYTGDGGVVSKKELERRIVEDVMGDYCKHGFGRMAVGLKGGPDFIGFAGMKYLEDLDEVDLGFRFMREYWGKGIATEAAKACLDYGFGELGLKRIIDMVLPENGASIRVLEKCGFVFEKEMLEDEMLVRVYGCEAD
ncbi:MAG: GNAT family N-acetyltransferase [Bacteroidia bacterium]